MPSFVPQVLANRSYRRRFVANQRGHASIDRIAGATRGQSLVTKVVRRASARRGQKAAESPYTIQTLFGIRWQTTSTYRRLEPQVPAEAFGTRRE